MAGHNKVKASGCSCGKTVDNGVNCRYVAAMNLEQNESFKSWAKSRQSGQLRLCYVTSHTDKAQRRLYQNITCEAASQRKILWDWTKSLGVDTRLRHFRGGLVQLSSNTSCQITVIWWILMELWSIHAEKLRKYHIRSMRSFVTQSQQAMSKLE